MAFELAWVPVSMRATASEICWANRVPASCVVLRMTPPASVRLARMISATLESPSVAALNCASRVSRVLSTSLRTEAVIPLMPSVIALAAALRSPAASAICPDNPVPLPATAFEVSNRASLIVISASDTPRISEPALADTTDPNSFVIV